MQAILSLAVSIGRYLYLTFVATRPKPFNILIHHSSPVRVFVLDGIQRQVNGLMLINKSLLMSKSSSSDEGSGLARFLRGVCASDAPAIQSFTPGRKLMQSSFSRLATRAYLAFLLHAERTRHSVPRSLTLIL